tara:strand:+ start:1459 stop:1695 length:237 start_codon:yes stop_codon:yes gene_type:complete
MSEMHDERGTNPFFCIICSKKIDKWARFNAITCSGKCKTQRCRIRKEMILEKYHHQQIYRKQLNKIPKKGITKENKFK